MFPFFESANMICIGKYRCRVQQSLKEFFPFNFSDNVKVVSLWVGEDARSSRRRRRWGSFGFAGNNARKSLGRIGIVNASIFQQGDPVLNQNSNGNVPLISALHYLE